MKNTNLILIIIILISVFQINFLFCSSTDITNIEKSHTNETPLENIHQQANGILILTPQEGEVIKGLTSIQWEFLFPYNLAEIIVSDVYYSPDAGLNWIQIAYGIRNNSLDWNTTLYEEYGTNFKVKITALSKEWSENLETISEGSFTIDNRPKSNFPWYLYIVIPVLIISTSSAISLFIYQYRLKKQYSLSFLKTNQTDKIRELNQKVIIGLDNIKDENKFISEISSTSSEAISLENGSTAQYFSSSFHNELKSEIRGRTVLVLIEIAYQNPSETNPVKIAEGVGIPLSTLSKEIKRLITLNYIETHVSNQVLLDARYRNFKITSKGFEFLNILNRILKNTISQIQYRNGISPS